MTIKNLRRTTTSGTLRRLALLALLVPTLAGARAADASALRIAVWDATTKNELDQLAPGDVLVLEQGRSVILRLFTPAGQRGSEQRTYVPGVWRQVEEPQLISLSEVNADKGSGLVRALTVPHNPKSAAQLRFRTTDGRNEEGSIRVFVNPAPGAPHVKPPVDVVVVPPTIPPPVVGVGRSQVAIQGLYRGILLREPDNEAWTWAETIEKNDFAGLSEVAQKIASSDESRVQLYSRDGATAQQRLAALYRHLLGLEPDRVATDVWNRNLDRVSRGDITGVVSDLIHTSDYRRRFGFSQPYNN